MDFLAPILTKIKGETAREALINLNRLVSINEASVALNLGGGQHRHLALTTTSEKYVVQTSYAFVPPHSPDNYRPKMGTSQEQALRTEDLQQNQALSGK